MLILSILDATPEKNAKADFLYKNSWNPNENDFFVTVMFMLDFLELFNIVDERIVNNICLSPDHKFIIFPF